MVEKHPFGDFVPEKTRYLLLGSFTGRQAIEGLEKEKYDWFYGTKRNQFWPILEEVYGMKLPTKSAKQNLFKALHMALTDIILSCERKANNNLDMNLTNMVFNKKVADIINENNVNTIYFSSRFVEKLFKKHFKEIISKNPVVNLITLPSPSPRYAAISKLEKIKLYKKLLPKLN